MNEADEKKTLPLVKPHVPPLEELYCCLEQIWSSRILTNNGRWSHELEKALCGYLGLEYISLVSSGTLALLIALRALNLKGEVITTPFSHVATAQAIHWNGLKPVFVDINETDFSIDPAEIEKALTSKTVALLPVHVFGNPCDVQALDLIAKKKNLSIVYDATHCFGIEISGKTICRSGDLSVLSFHATKVYNTIEGGAIICHDKKTKARIDALCNNGLSPDGTLAGYGLNAKMNELQAAYGLCQMKYVDEIIEKRKAAYDKYSRLLSEIKGIRMALNHQGIKHNYCYCPIVIDQNEFGASRDEIHDWLSGRNITTKKYFANLIPNFKQFASQHQGEFRVAEKISGEVLCLPLFHDISDDEIALTTDAISRLHQLRSR